MSYANEFSVFNWNVDGILNAMAGVTFSDEAGNRKSKPIRRSACSLNAAYKLGIVNNRFGSKPTVFLKASVTPNW